MNYSTSNMQLVAAPTHGNWDIMYSEVSDHFYAIARPYTGAKSSHFGSIEHIKRLVRQGHFADSLANLTAYGRELLGKHGIK